MKYVYMVQFDWSTVDSGDIETDLFSNYDDAHRYFKEIIENERKNSRLYKVFDKDGVINNELYEFDQSGNHLKKTNLFWHVVDKENYYSHSFIDLIKKKLDERR